VIAAFLVFAGVSTLAVLAAVFVYRCMFPGSGEDR
jgi:hypothetical protein